VRLRADYPALVGARFVAGAGAALVLTTGTIVLADITTPAERGRAMAIYQASSSSRSASVHCRAASSPSGTVCTRRFSPTPPPDSSPRWSPGCTCRDPRLPASRWLGPDHRCASFAAQIRLLTGHVGFLLVGLVSFTNAVARTGGLFNVIPVLARDRLGVNADRIGFGLALASLVGLALAYPAGVMVDRYGRKIVIAPATIMAGLSITLFLLAPSYGWFLVACIVWSIASGISGAAPAAYAADVAPPGMNAAAMSTYRMLGISATSSDQSRWARRPTCSAPVARWGRRGHARDRGGTLRVLRAGEPRAAQLADVVTHPVLVGQLVQPGLERRIQRLVDRGQYVIELLGTAGPDDRRRDRRMRQHPTRPRAARATSPPAARTDAGPPRSRTRARASSAPGSVWPLYQA
jgi:hypothetical protein